MDPIGLAFCSLVIGVALLGSSGSILRLQVLLLFLGGTATIPIGPTVTVPNFCLPFLALRAFLEWRRSRRTLRVGWATFWLGCTVGWGAVLAFVIPRALEGEILVFQRGLGVGNEAGTLLLPIRPVKQNISQTFNALFNFTAFAAGRFLLGRPERVALFRRAVGHLSIMMIAVGLIDIIEHYTGIPSILDPFRTAYAALDQALHGMPRIAGTFPETSAYSAAAIGLFAFNLQLSLDGRNRQATVLAGLLLVLLLLTTSGTAYGGLALYALILLPTVLVRLRKGQSIPTIAWLLALVPLVGAVLVFLLVIDSPIIESLQGFFERTILDKAGSQSGEERGSWSAQGIRNFIDTWGIGVGFGSNIVNGFLVALLSNVGVLGTIAYLLFLKRVLRSAHPGQPAWVAATSNAARHAMLAGILAASLSSTNFAMDLAVYLFAAMASIAGDTPRQGDGPAPPIFRTWFGPSTSLSELTRP